MVLLRERFKRLMARLAPFAAAASAALLLWHAANDRPSVISGTPAPLIYADALPAASSASLAAAAPAQAPAGGGIQEAGVAAATIDVVVGRNDTLDRIFRRMALSEADLAAIRGLPGIRQSIDFLRPGDSIKVTHTDGEIRELTRKVSETETLKVVRQPDGFAAQVITHPTETRVRTAVATIDSSLFEAAEAAGLSDAEALKFTNIFAWDIDFAQDLRSGDHFTAVYEQIYQDGRYLHDGEVLAAEFVNAGRVYRAVRYTNDEGVAGYYTPQGLPMRKALLRTPVEFTRISSAFNPHRLHPILQRIRGHMGIDYAAPTGTPVHAAGDGRVSFAGRRGGYGNVVMLTHANGIATLYGHLSRLAPRAHAGMRVHQGDVIGYVGMTGLATGPHLHYEFLVGGIHKNPQTVRLPGAQPLQPESLRKFDAAASPLLAMLEPAPQAATAAAH
jgi:murein DD-endopeptidase MepM/ murein hydrolase activator NlpD